MISKRFSGFRKIPAALIAAAVLFVSVFSCAYLANAASTFTPRLDAPSKSNDYYYSDKNIFYKYGYGMPNCTAYAYGRAYEILGSEPKLCPYGADEWYDYNKDGGYYKYGQTPKLGAVACWTYKDGGHVAVVEKIENGTVTFSNSAWGYLEFYLTTASAEDENPGQSGWDFQGYIYIGEFASPEPTAPAEYKTGVYEVSVDSTLNMRSGAGTGYSYVQSLYNGDCIEVTQIEAAGGYTWGYTTVNGQSGWVALDYCNYVSDLPYIAAPEEPTYNFRDVNYDGVLDINDVTSIQLHLSLISPFNGEQLELADFDSSGTVSIDDATQLQFYLARNVNR